MNTFTVALLGAPDTGRARLCEALADAADALEQIAWPVSVVLADAAASIHCDLTLLMGLPHPQLPVMAASDQLIRLELARTGTAYNVLYGNPHEQLAQALGLVEKKLGTSLTEPLLQPFPAEPKLKPKRKPWVWLCDTCSDPQCEHQLLTQLLAQRSTAR